MSILVSVIIPCFNVEDYIEECLISVINQTYKNIEIIVVDNNCTDGTIQKATNFSYTKKIEISIIGEQNQGLSFARNAGLKFSKGEWIQFLDADDLLLPDKIEHQINLIDINVDLIAAATIERNTDGLEFILKPHDNTLYGLIAGYRNVGSSGSNLWRKSILCSLNGFDTEQMSSEEIDMMFRIYTTGGFILNDIEPKTIIRKRRAGQMSQGNKSELALFYLRLRTKQIKYILEQGIVFENKEEFRSLYNKINYRLYFQFQDYPQLSHAQYHSTFEPFFNLYKSTLPLKEKLKLFLYKWLGYQNVRKFLNVLK